MVFYILKRILATVPVMGFVALFVFLMLRLSPGDPAAVIAGDYATTEDIIRIRENLGLNEPIIVQFTKWIGQLVQGDLGISIFTNLPVTTLISQRLEPTIMLTLTTIIFTIVLESSFADRRLVSLTSSSFERHARNSSPSTQISN